MWAIDIFMVIGPVLGYISQYKIIHDSRSLGTFSIDVCAILLTSNILRVFYWYSARFSQVLLYQALLMILAQILLLHLCIKVRNQQGYQIEHQCIELVRYSILALEPLQKLQYSCCNSVLFIVSYTLVLAGLTFLFVDIYHSKRYGQVIGYISLATEATLGFPQMIKNFQQKSVEGLSYILIMSWFLGDLSKTLYFIIYKHPLQFILCGVVQLTVDTTILVQMWLYKKVDDPEAAVQYDQLELAESPAGREIPRHQPYI